VSKNGQPAYAARPAIAIIIAALDEEAALPAAVAALARQTGAPPFEAILADGGSRDHTIAIFRRLTRDWPSHGRGARVVVSHRTGRAAQMNAGLEVARSPIVLFLHADTVLPDGALRAVLEVMADPAVSGGGFSLGFTDSSPLLRLIAGWATLRSRLLHVHYGDQAPFVRRDALDRIGGVPQVALFEDLELARAVKRAGRVVPLRLTAGTSARRLRSGGIAHTALRFAWLKLRYALGTDPDRLRDQYRDVR